MIFALISLVVSVSCLVIFLYYRDKTKNPGRNKKIEAAAASVRISYLLCLCAVPFLSFTALILKNDRWAYYAEAAVIVEGFATLLMGLMALLQRYGALFFKMPPAMERNEILVLVFFPVAVYLSYMPANIIIGYYMAPGIYSVYLTYTLLKRRA